MLVLYILQRFSIAKFEKLKIQGYISYPRTETTQYPAGFDARQLAQKIGSLGDAVLAPAALATLSAGLRPAKAGKDVGDHPPITPLSVEGARGLQGDAARLFEYIVLHFLATVRFCECGNFSKNYF